MICEILFWREIGVFFVCKKCDVVWFRGCLRLTYRLCIAWSVYGVDHGLDNWGIMVRFRVGSRELFCKASKAMGATLPPTRSEPVDKVAGGWSWPLAYTSPRFTLCGSVPLFRLRRSWSPQGEFTFMLLGFCYLALKLPIFLGDVLLCLQFLGRILLYIYFLWGGREKLIIDNDESFMSSSHVWSSNFSLRVDFLYLVIISLHNSTKLNWRKA